MFPQTAQVVLYDALIDHGVLAHAHPDAIRVDVGNRRGEKCGQKQADINAELIRYGFITSVVRLKGGDPAILDDWMRKSTQCGLLV